MSVKYHGKERKDDNGPRATYTHTHRGTIQKAAVQISCNQML